MQLTDLLTHGRWVALGLVASVLLTAATPALAAPGAVEATRDSVVKIERQTLNASGFAIDRRGSFLTTEQAASRGTDIKVVFSNGVSRPARRVESDAPAGLAVIRVSNAPKMKPLDFAPGGPNGGRRSPGSVVWSVPGRGIASPVRGLVVGRPSGQEASGVLFIVEPAIRGTSGSPVMDDQGRVVAVQRADRFRADQNREAVVVTRRPVVLPAIVPKARNDFPAIPVVIGLGILLLLANIFFSMRRRREVAAVAQAAGTPSDADPQAGGAQVAAPTKPEPDDDLEISLKSKPNGAGKPAKLTVDPDAAPAPSGDEDPDELVTLKGR